MANKKVSQLTSKPSVLVTDLFPIADPSTGQLYKTTISDLGTAIGSGVSSVNGLVGAVVLDTDDIQELVSPTNKWFTDTRARAALSASSPLAYNSGTGVFSIPAATSSQNGYLTSTDWTTFNSKQAALSGTGFVKISGTTISYDNSTYLTTSAAASTYLPLTGGTLTGALTLGTASGDNQTLLNLPASTSLIYREGVGSLYGFNIESGIDNSLFLTNTEGGYYQTLYFGDSTGGYNVFGFSTSSNSGTTWNPRFVINQNGYIGLNKNNPTEILDVSGNGLFSGSLTANSIVKSGGTSSQFLKADGSIDSNSYALTSQLHNAVTIGTANGLSLSTQVLSLGLASSSANGALSSTDWTTFNGKQAALSGTGFVKISGTTISYDNTSYLPLTGGTLTGTLNGTNINITNSLIAKGGTFNGGASYGGIVTIDGLGSDLLMNRANTSNGSSITLLTNAVEKWNIGLRSAGTTDNFFIYNSNLTANSLTINSSNSAATFASSVTATSHIVLGGTSSQFQKGDGSLDSNTYLTTSSASSTYLAKTGGTLTGALTVTNANINLLNAYYLTARNNANTAYLALIGRNTSDKVVIDPDGYGLTVGGAATFSSSVTAGSTSSGAQVNVYASSYGNNGLFNAYGTDGNIKLQMGGLGTNEAFIYTGSGNKLSIFTGGATSMTITSAGNVGIGTTTISQNFSGYTHLDIGNATTGGILLFSNASGTNYGYVNGEAGGVNMRATVGNLTFNAGASERMRITSGGNVLIGTTGTSWTNTPGTYIFFQSACNVTRDGAEAMNLNRLNSDGTVLHFHKNGSQVGNVSVTGSATFYNSISDYRLKQDFKSINGLDLLNKIKVYNYEWKSDKTRMDGVIAHELAEVLPYAVQGLKDGEQMQSVDYSKIVPVMVQAIKDLKAELDTLKNK